LKNKALYIKVSSIFWDKFLSYIIVIYFFLTIITLVCYWTCGKYRKVCVCTGTYAKSKEKSLPKKNHYWELGPSVFITYSSPSLPTEMTIPNPHPGKNLNTKDSIYRQSKSLAVVLGLYCCFNIFLQYRLPVPHNLQVLLSDFLLLKKSKWQYSRTFATLLLHCLGQETLKARVIPCWEGDVRLSLVDLLSIYVIVWVQHIF
jgi:hypothetical protein